MHSVGAVIWQTAAGRTHRYRLTAIEKWTNQHHIDTVLLVWEGSCVICGQPFVLRTSAGSHRYLTRTCPAHRTPRPRRRAAPLGAG